MNLFFSSITFILLIVGAQAAPTNDLDQFFSDKTKIENPVGLRDPFKAPPPKAGRKKEAGQAGVNYVRTEKGEFNNIAEIPLNNVNIFELKVVGVLIGKERRAMIIPGGETKQVVVIKEGTKLGQDNAEVKAILPGGIILVEKIVNVYGQEEYLETVIPISQ